MEEKFNMNKVWTNWKIPERVKSVLNKSSSVKLIKDRKEILSMATGGGKDFFEVAYEVEEKSRVVKDTV